jgi:phytanoyl-CoA hydroxylase
MDFLGATKGDAMQVLQTPNGLTVNVPEDLSEDVSPHFALTDLDAIAAYYREHGYVVVSSVFTPEECDQIRTLWDAEIKPFKGKIYRQATAKLEPHVLNDKGWVMNPILNLQSVDPGRFPRFRRYAREQILAGKRLHEVFQRLFGEPGKVVQSMYFEGNSATWEHQDSYYLDSEHMGTMAAAWIAIEDISPTAGRFFVCPGTHKIDWKRQSAEDNVATAHEVYVQSVVDKMRETKAEVRAPALRKGDVLFWNGLTIHGSLNSHDPERARSSVTCHAIPASHKFMQYQKRITDPATDQVNGVRIHAPKDLASLKNRAVKAVEENFPGPFYALKRFAIEQMMKKSA